VNDLDTLPGTYKILLNGVVVALRTDLQEALDDADAFLIEHPRVERIEVRSDSTGGTWIRLNSPKVAIGAP
jgi:hypothetical protein